jgi:hypothetical protein
MSKNSDEPIEATTCGSSDGGQLACPASWPRDDEVEDAYDDLLASIGRTEEEDRRIAIHELSHFFANRLLGISSIVEVTINPAADYEGLCRGARRAAFTKEGVAGVDAADIRKILQPRRMSFKAFSMPSRN